MKLRRIKFGLLILLVFSLQVRFALAAQNWCPWMQTPMLASALLSAQAEMPDCEGMSPTGECHLQPVCAALPLLSPTTSLVESRPLPSAWIPSLISTVTSQPRLPPERVPIF